MGEITLSKENLSATFAFSIINQFSANCGFEVLQHVTLTVYSVYPASKNNPWITRKYYPNLPTEETFRWLDDMWPKIFPHMPTKMTMLSDGVGGNVSKDFYGKKQPADIGIQACLYTAQFVAWLISRKHGAVFRGPIVNNTNYMKRGQERVTGHGITSWIWVPNRESLLVPETLSSIPEDWKSLNPADKIAAQAHEYHKNESLLNEGKYVFSPS